MGAIFRFIRRAISLVGDVQAIWAVVPAGMLAGLSGYSGYLRDGLGWGIFIASGVFAFITLGGVIIRENYRANRLEHKLNVSGIGVVQHPATGEDGISFFRPLVTLQSTAGFDMQFELTRADFNFAGTKTGLDIATLKGVIAPRDSANLTIPSAKGFAPLATGKCIVEVRYGRAGEPLTHLLSTKLECAPTHPSPHTLGPVDLMVVRNIDALNYSRIKA